MILLATERARRVPRSCARLASLALAATLLHPAAVAQHAPAPPAAAPAGWLVLAPHPDDAVLIAGGVIARAVAEHVPVWVAVMTNGDLGCARDGLLRERESVAGLAALGLDEAHLFFLGYPDGSLARLGDAPLPPLPHRLGARCVRDDHTYGARGRARRDFHSARFGAPAAYTAANAVGDLRALLAWLRPADVVVTHPADTHPDHAATYAQFRRAVDGLDEAPRVHRALVHTGDCWPLGDAPAEPCPPPAIAPDTPTPPLVGALAGYVPTERRPVPPALRARDAARNPKLRAIAAHASQTGGSPSSYLFAFAHRDEPFFVERLARGANGWVRRGSASFWRRGAKPPAATLAPGATWRVAQRAPLALRLDVPAGRALRLVFLADDAGGYALAIDPGAKQAALWRQDGGRARLLHEWPLPHDAWRAGAEPIELRVEPRPDDGDVAELTLLRRGLLVGVAVDVHPRRAGARIEYAAGAAPLPLALDLSR